MVCAVVGVMEQTESRCPVVSLEGCLFDCVHDKYDVFWESGVRYWMKEFDFPPNSSLSVKVLDRVEERLHMHETDLRKSKSMTV